MTIQDIYSPEQIKVSDLLIKNSLNRNSHGTEQLPEETDRESERILNGGGEVVEGLGHPVLLPRQVPVGGGAQLPAAGPRRRQPEPDTLGAALEE
jgi:hypothetical protein